MIRITKDQRFKLEKMYGFKVGKEIHKTHSKPQKYYLIESDRCLRLLNEIK